MKHQYDAIIIGGGITGVAIVYHLAKRGMTNVALIERRELTAGSTWHAAAGNNQLHDVTNIAALQAYTIDYFKKIQEETGQSCGIHPTGGLYIARTEVRVDQLKIMAAKAQYLGCTFKEISAEEALELNPLLQLEDAKAIYFTPHENYVDPNGATQAYAKGAKAMGADVIRFNAVLETNLRDDGKWDVVTEQGAIVAGHVINAAGLWAREVARLAGIEVPVIPMEHQYLVTETIPEVAALTRETPTLHDNDAEYYMRQEHDGFLFGAYEKGGVHWAVDGTPLDFDTELLPNDLDRIAENYELACERVPVLATAGIKSVVNGPMIWSPDVSPVVGPVPGIPTYWMAVGIMAGFSQSAGIGKVLADWIIDGQPESDMGSIDVARFGSWADADYAYHRSAENYSTRYRIYFPYEERKSGRKKLVRPVYDRQAELGAVFGASAGWEYPKYYARNAEEANPQYSFRRANWFDVVGDESRALRNSAGLIDVSNYAKFRITGADSEEWLDTLLTNNLPTAVGGVCLSPMCDKRGRLQGDFTVAMLAENEYLMIGSGAVEQHYLRYMDLHRKDLDAKIESLTAAWAGFNVAGPKAREILENLVEADVSNEALPFFGSVQTKVAGVDCFVLRVSYSGELGYEIYTDEANQLALWEALIKAGQPFDIRPVGVLALHAMRMEKGYGGWGLELTSDYTPYEAGLGFLVKNKGADYIGKAALADLKGPPARKLCLFEIDSEDADAFGGEPVFYNGEIVGEVTSGSFGHCVGKSLALAYVHGDAKKQEEGFEISVVGERRPAKRLPNAPYDPSGSLLRN